MKSCRTFLRVWGLLIASFVFCQPQEPQFSQIREGLSQSSVTSILQDRSGHFWIGTPNGLNKYNGRTFEITESSPEDTFGLSNSYIESIFEDSSGKIWIGTNQGLNFYNRELDVIQKYESSPRTISVEPYFIRVITEIDGFIWLGTAQGGILRINPGTKEVDRIQLPDSINSPNNENFVFGLVPIAKPRVLAVTTGGLHVLNTSKMKVESTSTDIRRLSASYKDPRGQVWLGTFDGRLIQVKMDQNSHPISLQSRVVSMGNRIMSINSGPAGRLWIGTENGGLSILDPATSDMEQLHADENNSQSIGSNSIWCLYKAKDNVMWVGTYANGISVYDPDYYKFPKISERPNDKNSLSHNTVTSFLEDAKGNLWVGTDGGGLNYWNRERNQFSSITTTSDPYRLSSNAVLSLTYDLDSNLWVGTWAGGINIIDKKSGSISYLNSNNSFLSSNNTYHLHRDSRNRIWAASFLGGVDIIDLESNESRHIDLISSLNNFRSAINIATITEDRRGNYWIGTQNNGAFKLTPTKTDFKIRHYGKSGLRGALSNNYVYTIYEDNRSNIWIGTPSGLHRYLPESDRFEVFTESQGLVDNAIKGILADQENHLWLSSNEGLMEFDLNSLTVLSSYDEFDGLQSNEFFAGSAYMTSDQELLFGGLEGFNIFRPQEIEVDNSPPKIYFTQLRIFNEEVFPGDDFKALSVDINMAERITLTYEHTVFSLDFVGLDFRHPEKVQYAYYMEGFENDWNYAGNSYSATYTNLDPGLYTFKVKASNSDGIWNEAGISIPIVIKPPYWSTWWFRLFLGLFMASLIFAIYHIRVHSIKQRQQFLEKEIAQRTKELEEQKSMLMAAAGQLEHANEQVNRVNDELHEKNEEIQRFTYAVSHDLKSPLSTILGFSSIIGRDVGSKSYDKVQEHLEYITNACYTMENLIADVTEIAKLGKIENHLEDLDTNEIVDLATMLVKGKIEDKQVIINVQEHLPTIHGDRNRMMQVFENLIDNAIKYMGDQPSPIIDIGVNEKPKYHCFFVKDNGMGIAENHVKRIFQPFERVNKNIEGTGLGLAMIQKVIESHGGRIWVESDGPGKGSTFCFKIPTNHEASVEEQA